MKQLWIMVAGPYNSGAKNDTDRKENLDGLNRIGYEIFQKGHIPIIGVNMALPIIDLVGKEKFDELMMPISLAAAKKCDAVIRVGGESKGADQELELIRSNGGTLFNSVDDIPKI